MQRHVTSYPILLCHWLPDCIWVTADGCVHIVESVGSRRELVANSCTHRRRRRDTTRQFRRVGGVYWALHTIIHLHPMSIQPSIPPGWVNGVPACQDRVGAERVHLCRVASNTL